MNKKTGKMQNPTPVGEILGVTRGEAAKPHGVRPADGDKPNRRYEATVALHNIRVGDNIRKRPITLELDPKLADLVADIKANGILEPVLLNQLKKGVDKFDLIAGARRLAAVTLAELPGIPSIIYEGLTADQVKDVQYAENAHRLDLLPSEEAEWYRFLYVERNCAVEAISLRTGKSPKHISRYIKLAKLPEKVLGRIDDGEIPIGKAEKLASCPESVISDIVEHNSYSLTSSYYSAKDFAEHIERKYFESLDKVKFDKTKVYKSGKKTYPACVDSEGNSTCPDRGRQLEMFEEYNDCGTCPNKDCYAAKVAIIETAKRKKKEKIKEEKEAAKATKNGGVQNWEINNAMDMAENSVRVKWYLDKKIAHGFSPTDLEVISDFCFDYSRDKEYSQVFKECVGADTDKGLVKSGTYEQLVITAVINWIIDSDVYDADDLQYMCGITKKRHDKVVETPELEELVKAAREKAKADLIAREAKKVKKDKK